MLRGVAYSDDLVNDIKHEIVALMEREHYTDVDRRGALKAKIGKAVRNQARRSLHSVPMVLPIIVEV